MLQRTASTVRALHAPWAPAGDGRPPKDLVAEGLGEDRAERDGSTGLWNSGSRFCVTIEPKGISNLR